ncbi:uncharacterized protein LTR77_000568 [Saxophila tyrrhenica]|uniref:AAA+ ATPase domain-containing protein n=1 Tax=Saxophila tyrrhenica TaxID=1690608 RepID=A0AAV9PN17_9PEZI|nr:hypothetical protein LTR77_000568 [Saxophila tyrrhenica]
MSNQQSSSFYSEPQQPQTQSSSTSGDSALSTPSSTSSSTQHRASVQFAHLSSEHKDTMDDKPANQDSAPSDRQEREEPTATTETKPKSSDAKLTCKKKGKCKKHDHDEDGQAKKSKKKSKSDKSVASDSSDDSSEDSSDSDSSSEEETPKKRRSTSANKGKGKKGRRKSKKIVEDSDTESEIEYEEEEDVESAEDELDPLSGGASDSALKVSLLEQQLAALKRQMLGGGKQKAKKAKAKTPKSKSKPGKGSFSTKFKRVDQLWDTNLHQFKMKESAEEDESEFADYAFLVRRTFDWENKYRDTVVDIKSKLLRSALWDVLKDCKSVSLEAEEPTVDPNILFLYLEELRTHYKKTVKAKVKAEKKRKVAKKLEQSRQLLKIFVRYLDEDYADIKKTLYPLLKAGNITFDLLWALYKPNEVAVTSCYGSWEEPRCFKVEYANKCASMTRGEWYCIEGRYLEYDGKGFGYGDFEVDVEAFKGPRRISSLATYPLKYHAEPEAVKKQIIARGEKFVGMEGMHYKFHKGMAFHKKKKQVLKINVNGRVMLDPATFRRVNPNYPISWIKPKNDDDDLFNMDSDGSDDDCCCGSDSDDEAAATSDRRELQKSLDGDDKPKYKYKWSENSRGDTVFVRVEVDADGDPIPQQHVDKLAETADARKHTFTEDELLLTSPVILGFAFGEKLWLEFTISGVHDITYNENAFESLVLPPNQKSIVRALVESHKSHGAKTIDDVVVGKGKGLVAVLHGPPGTGKTLTAEGISELLKCPLYMVSAGELGTDPGRLEHQLQQILDIAHTWGAVLLLDEADVFLEKREVHDIHRNALVSIFLRLLEYFQGILFLTTNRVETFDDAFQSRIHVALRYGELTHKAKKAVWRMFLDLVRKVEGMEVAHITDEQIDILSRNQLNGRQIKNLVRTAQALALNEGESLTLEHIKRVIAVAESFDRDLRGGTGVVWELGKARLVTVQGTPSLSTLVRSLGLFELKHKI